MGIPVIYNELVDIGIFSEDEKVAIEERNLPEKAIYILNIFYSEIQSEQALKTVKFWNFLNTSESERRHSYGCRIKKMFLSEIQTIFDVSEVKMKGRKKCLDAHYEGQIKKIKTDYEAEKGKFSQKQDNWTIFKSINIDKYFK